MTDFLLSLLPTIEQAHAGGYWIVFFVVLVESLPVIGLAVPSGPFVAAVAFLSAQGFVHFGTLIWFAAAGGIVGETIGFFAGRRLSRVPRNRILPRNGRLAQKGRDFFERYGNKSVFLSQFAGLSSLVAFMAGISEMDAAQFFVWNVAGTVLWVVAVAYVGFFFGNVWQVVSLWMTRAEIFGASLLVLLVILYVLRNHFIKNGRGLVAFSKSVWNSLGTALMDNPDVQRVVARHPIFFRNIKKRLAARNFFGLPLTLLALAFVYLLFLFAGVVAGILTSPDVVAMDIRAANLVALVRNDWVAQIFVWVTTLGSAPIILVFVLASAVVLLFRGKRAYLSGLLLATGGSAISVEIIKMMVHRTRPNSALYIEHSFSFPSFHAALALAFYGFAAYILIRARRGWKRRVNIFFAAFLLSLLIGGSRLYLGTHFLSDVWGGYFLGALWLIVAIGITEWLGATKKEWSVGSVHKRVRLVSFACVAVSVPFYYLWVKRFGPTLVPSSSLRTETSARIVHNVKDVFSGSSSPFTETLLAGKQQEPISFIVVARSDNDLVSAFRKSGWFLADPGSLSIYARFEKALLLKEPYPSAPMTPSSWNARSNDFGFEKATSAESVKERHHARFWKTNALTPDKKNIYVGTASLDTAIKWFVAHSISPDIDTERGFLAADLSRSGNVSASSTEQLVSPILGKNFTGDPFFTDGKVVILFLK